VSVLNGLTSTFKIPMPTRCRAESNLKLEPTLFTFYDHSKTHKRRSVFPSVCFIAGYRWLSQRPQPWADILTQCSTLLPDPTKKDTIQLDTYNWPNQNKTKGGWWRAEVTPPLSTAGQTSCHTSRDTRKFSRYFKMFMYLTHEFWRNP
jgi:hypothetical protein